MYLSWALYLARTVGFMPGDNRVAVKHRLQHARRHRPHAGSGGWSVAIRSDERQPSRSNRAADPATAAPA